MHRKKIKKSKIIETETFSIDERIKIISGIFAVMGEKGEYVRKISSSTFMLINEIYLSLKGCREAGIIESKRILKELLKFSRFKKSTG